MHMSWYVLLYINILIIGASRSEPRTYDEYATAVCVYIMYVCAVRHAVEFYLLIHSGCC